MNIGRQVAFPISTLTLCGTAWVTSGLVCCWRDGRTMGIRGTIKGPCVRGDGILFAVFVVTLFMN